MAGTCNRCRGSASDNIHDPGKESTLAPRIYIERERNSCYFINGTFFLWVIFWSSFTFFCWEYSKAVDVELKLTMLPAHCRLTKINPR